MSKKSHNKRKRRERAKKNVFNAVMVFIIITLLVAVAFTASLYFYTMETMGTVVFPKTPLTKMMEQPYNYIPDDTLDVSIQCPSIPVVLSVGGTERNVSDNGCVFRYNSDLSISIYELDVTSNAFDILSTQFATDLYTGSLSGTAQYINDLETIDVGYFNGYPAEYQCGTVNVLDANGNVTKKIYVVTMVLDMGFDKHLMITASTTETSSLYDAGILVESIGYTVVDTSLTQTSLSGATKLNESETSLPIDLTEDDFSVTVEVEDSSDREITVMQTEKMDVQVPVTKDYDDGVYIVFQYTGEDVDVFDLLLVDIDGMEHAPSADSKDGLAVFVLDIARKGNYTIKVPASDGLGTFNAVVLSVEEYTEKYGGGNVLEESVSDENKDA